MLDDVNDGGKFLMEKVWFLGFMFYYFIFCLFCVYLLLSKNMCINY